MYKITKAINEAVQECIDNGRSSYIVLEDSQKTLVTAEWESFEKDNNFDCVAVYLIQNGSLKMSYQVEETIVKC